MAERNARLRAARECLPSRRVPGEHLTRAELAEMVNMWLWEHTGHLFELDDHLIGKWERGVVRYPIAPYRAALRTVLDVDTDAASGFTPPRSATPTGATDATSGEWTLGATADDAAHMTEWELINRRDALRGRRPWSAVPRYLGPLARRSGRTAARRARVADSPTGEPVGPGGGVLRRRG